MATAQQDPVIDIESPKTVDFVSSVFVRLFEMAP